MNLSKINIKVKHVSIVLALFFLLTLLPILIIGRYDHPSADDYSLSSATRQMWVQTHSVWQVVREAAATSADRYQTWTGIFVSVFFSALQPAIWGEQAYALTPFLMLGLLSVSVIYLVHVLIIHGLKGTRHESSILSLLILLLIIQCMISKNEAFFWFNGAIVYIMPFSFLLLMFGNILSYLFNNDGKKKTRQIVFASLCSLFVGGGNYISGLLACICCLSLIMLLLYTKNFHANKMVCIPILLLFVFFIINMTAPGNSVRASSVQGMSPIHAVFISFRYALTYAIDSWTDWTLIALVLFWVPFCIKTVQYTKFRFPYPLLVAAYSYCLLSSAFTPSLFAVGNVQAGRIQNIIFILYVLLVFLNVGYAIGWLCRHFHLYSERTTGGTDTDNRETLSNNQKIYILFAAFAILFCLGITVKPNPKYYTATAAITELVNGEARSYDEEIKLRLEILQLPEDDITFPHLTTYPSLLFFSDITADAEDWSNRGMSRYYGKKSIVLVE